ncbi:MAG: FecR domain-containing protein, partial [Candidatus Omnitrophota bacterium]
VTIVDQTGTGDTDQTLTDFSNLVGGATPIPETEPFVLPPQIVTPPVSDEQTSEPQLDPETFDVSGDDADFDMADTSDEMDISFDEPPTPGREPVPVAEDKKSSSETAEAKSSSEGESAKEESTGDASGKDDGKGVNWRDVPIGNFFGNEDTKKFMTDVRVIEGTVYVIDGANVMNLLGMGDSMRVFYKRKKTTDRRRQTAAKDENQKTADGRQQTTDHGPRNTDRSQQMTALAKAIAAVSSPESRVPSPDDEATPAPEARTLKTATPVVMQQTSDGTRYGTLKNPGKNVFVRSPGGDWKSAQDGMVILPGDEVKTAERNSVEVLIDGGKIGHVEIKEGSLFRIQTAETDAATGDMNTLLDLAIGKILVKVEALKRNSKFEVRTPTALTGVRGTFFEVTVKEKT